MVLSIALGILLGYLLIQCLPLFFALFAEMFETVRPEERKAGGEEHDADGIPFYPASQMCPSCKRQNNPRYEKCWKCAGDLPLAVLKAQLDILSAEALPVQERKAL